MLYQTPNVPDLPEMPAVPDKRFLTVYDGQEGERWIPEREACRVLAQRQFEVEKRWQAKLKKVRVNEWSCGFFWGVIIALVVYVAIDSLL